MELDKRNFHLVFKLEVVDAKQVHNMEFLDKNVETIQMILEMIFNSYHALQVVQGVNFNNALLNKPHDAYLIPMPNY